MNRIQLRNELARKIYNKEYTELDNPRQVIIDLEVKLRDPGGLQDAHMEV